MSLINDLVIEVDRRRSQAPRTDDAPLDGLAPRNRSRQSRIAAIPAAPVVALALLAGIATRLLAPGILASKELEVPSSSMSTAVEIEVPAVSARPVYGPAIVPSEIRLSLASEDRFGAAAAAAAAAAEPEDPNATIRSIALDHAGATTRLRITTDRPARYRIEPGPNEREIDVILESAVLGSRIPTFDLLDTPIRSFQTHGMGDDFRLSLRLDQTVRIQSQWIEEDTGSALVIDLQNPPTDLTDLRSLQPTHSGDQEQRPTRRARRRSRPPEYAADPIEERSDRLEAYGSRSDLHIARSADDRRREDLDAIQSRARAALEAARRARSEGDDEGADRLYRASLEERPGYREAVLERATLLASMDRRADAIAFVREAQRREPAEAAFAMLHARLLAETQDFDSAVRILDASRFSLTLAPEVHALAAAYLQRAGKHDRAIERYESILRRYPNESRWWMGLGISLEASNRRAEAIDVYRVAMRIGELPGQTRRWVGARITALGEEG